MKAIVRWGSGLAAVLLFTSASFAQQWVTPVLRMPFPPNPDACGPGYFAVNGCGAMYGPNHWVVPPYPPFTMPLPGPNGKCPSPLQMQMPVQGRPMTGIYPTHPYVRSPRDFFMWSDDMQDMRGRDIRPGLVVP